MKARRWVLLLALTASLFPGAVSFAAEFGTAAEAEELLARAVAEMAADPVAAVDKFNDPDGAFRDGDLYVFCARIADGKLTAHPVLVGTDLRTIRDKNGVPFGEQMLEQAIEGSTTEIPYMWPRPGDTEPAEKISYVIRIADQICGVGYYKQ